MGENTLTIGSASILSGSLYLPTRIQPAQHVEYPYQMTLAVPGIVIPFSMPGCDPRLVIGPRSAILAGCLQDPS